jgi:hypothetical protein
MDKAMLLDRIQSSYAEFEKVFALLDEALITSAGADGGWSIKDILAHIMAWHRRLLDRIGAIARNEEPAFLISGVGNGEIDRLNAQFYEENKARPLNEVLSDLRASHFQVVESVRRMTDEDLMDPQRFVWMDGDPFWKLVAGDTYEHYQEHMESIKELASRAKKA